MTNVWEEAKHPRRKNGEFGNADWAKTLSDKIGKDVGPKGGSSQPKVILSPKIDQVKVGDKVRPKGWSTSIEVIGKSGDKVHTDQGMIHIDRIAKVFPHSAAKTPKNPRVKKPIVLKGADVVNHVPSDDRTDLGPHETKAIDEYTAAGFEDMNGTLRNGSDHELLWMANQSVVDQHIQSLDSVFNKMPPLKHSIEVKRGIVQSENMFGPVGSRVGKTFSDKGYVSTTWHHQERYGSANRTTEGKADVTITVPAGSKAFRPWTYGAMSDSEGEILLPRGQRFKVVSDKMKSLVRHIELEMLA